MGGWIYIMSNKMNGTLYVGVTSDLVRRVYEHREGLVDGFTKTHELKRLVYFEAYDEIGVAIQREKSLKRWSRGWKVELIQKFNPFWDDLFDQICG